MRYRTIVVDPPWRYGKWGGFAAATLQGGKRHSTSTALPYAAMTVAEIAALSIGDLAAPDAHIYLWTTNRYLPDAFGVVAAWGFTYSQTLIWAKNPMGLGPGGTFAQSSEYVIFARRGTLKHKRRIDSTWFNWPRTGKHSKKPEHFLDLVESVSPGPYLEMFSRRHRLGWSVWGNQVESSIALEVPA